MANDNPLFSDVNIDGQIRKIIDTQHFTGSNNEGRVRSGEKNPFPVAGYGMTESGLWIPKRVSDDGAQHTQLTGSKVEYVRKSTEPKPQGKESDTLYLWDTRQVYFHDGTDWREI